MKPYSAADDNEAVIGRPYIDYKKLSRPITDEEREWLGMEIRKAIKGRAGASPKSSIWEDDTEWTIRAGE